MKKVFVIVFSIMSFCSYAQVVPTTDREILLDIAKQQLELSKQQAITNAKLDKLSEVVAELAKQQAITATKVDSLEKSVDKRFDTQTSYMLGLIGLIAVLIGTIFWDRRTALKPFEIKVIELEKEIVSLKERETKSENLLKKILEKYPDLAGLS